MNSSLLKWIRPEIRALSAYHVADASGLLKLDAMENPYALPDAVRQAWLEAASAAEINRYPDPAAMALKDTLQQLMRPPVDTAMILGNGSDELIQMLAMVVAEQGRCIMSFEPGFVMYRMIAEFVGMEYVGMPLDDGFDIDLDATLSAIETSQPAIIFIAYPNNPSANCFNESAIDMIIEAAPGLVVIDEAYHPFAQKSYMDKLQQYDQMLVMRTVSKMGLAGLRLGVLCGKPELIDEIDKVRLPYNINVLTQSVSNSVLQNTDALDEQAAKIREQRETMFEQLDSLAGIKPYPSDANFFLFRVEQKDAAKVFESIKQQGVLIKNMNASEGALKNCLRVTVGTAEENQAFLTALKNAI